MYNSVPNNLPDFTLERFTFVWEQEYGSSREGTYFY